MARKPRSDRFGRGYWCAPLTAPRTNPMSRDPTSMHNRDRSGNGSKRTDFPGPSPIPGASPNKPSTGRPVLGLGRNPSGAGLPRRLVTSHSVMSPDFSKRTHRPLAPGCGPPLHSQWAPNQPIYWNRRRFPGLVETNPTSPAWAVHFAGWEFPEQTDAEKRPLFVSAPVWSRARPALAPVKECSERRMARQSWIRIHDSSFTRREGDR